MPVISNQYLQGINQTTGTGAPTHSAVAGDRYTDTSTGNTYQYTTSWQTVSYSAGGLTYFTEAQNTSAPNATVPVDSLTAVSSTTNADMALLPKGTGAFIVGHIPDNTPTNGAKRGNYAVDIQPAPMNYAAGATGNNSVCIGSESTSSGALAVSIGYTSRSTSSGALALTAGYATGINSVAISSASTASNTYSFAIQGGNSSGAGGFAGINSTASGTNSLALSGTAYEGATASSTNSVAIGKGTVSNASHSISLGNWSSSKSIASKLSLGSFIDTAPYLVGSTQLGLSSSLANTTTNTTVELSTQGGTAICLTLQNNEAIRVKGSIIGKQTASTNVACYDFDCVVVRGTTAGSTILPLNNLNLVLDTITLDTIPSLTANTTIGGLSVKSGAKTTTTIKWSCRIDSTEVILA
jgi:hypothetical protein